MLNTLNELDLPHATRTSWIFQLFALKDSGRKNILTEGGRGKGQGGKEISVHSIYSVDKTSAEHCKKHC